METNGYKVGQIWQALFLSRNKYLRVPERALAIIVFFENALLKTAFGKGRKQKKTEESGSSVLKMLCRFYLANKNCIRIAIRVSDYGAIGIGSSIG